MLINLISLIIPAIDEQPDMAKAEGKCT